MMEWSLACTRGARVLCRILHNLIHLGAHLELAPCQSQKETTSCTRLLRTGWALDEKCLYFLSVWSDIVALIPIRQYLSYSRLPAGWGGDRHLRVDICWMSPHTSSFWPWTNTPKVRLYGTFLSGLHQTYTTFPRLRHMESAKCQTWPCTNTSAHAPTNWPKQHQLQVQPKRDDGSFSCSHQRSRISFIPLHWPIHRNCNKGWERKNKGWLMKHSSSSFHGLWMPPQ